MAFDALDPAALHIREAAGRNALSHALLFTGGGDLLSAARYAAAAMECQSPGERPCGVCPACRKVFEQIHPDVIAVLPEKGGKLLPVERVRAIRADAYVQPNEGARKVYLFPDCALLTEQDQNVLLKVVEEGPPYAAFLFCAENASQVLQTLRSRCVELKPRPAPAQGEPLPEAAESLLRALAKRKRGAVVRAAVGLERDKLAREKLEEALARCRTITAAALTALYGRAPEAEDRDLALILTKSLTKRQIMRTIEILEKYRRECAYNVGVGHVLGALAVELEGIL